MPSERASRQPEGRGALPVYDPAAHAEELVALQVSAFSVLALLWAARAPRGAAKKPWNGSGPKAAAGLVGGGAGRGGPGGANGVGGHAGADALLRLEAGGELASPQGRTGGQPPWAGSDVAPASSSAASGAVSSGLGGFGGATTGLAVVGAGEASRTGVHANEELEEEVGELVTTGVESADEGLALRAPDDDLDIGAGVAAVKRGDRSWTWRWPGTGRVDRLSILLQARVAPWSPLTARILNDAGYLRAMLGSLSVLLPVLGGVLGALAVWDVGGEALPPVFALAVALAVLGVFDALAGVIGVLVFVLGVIAFGGVSTGDEARTLLGVATLWFAAPLIAGTARPLRRPPSMTAQEHWERTADVVIASLVGAWAVQTMVLGLPGLAGLELPIAEQANTIALLVLGALALRLLIETVAAHLYPIRLSRVQPAEVDEPGTGQRVVANIVVTAVFVFVAVSYLGSCWQLYLGAALFLLPNLLGLYADRFPNSPKLYAALPTGIVETVLLLVVGGVVAAVVLSRLSGRDALQDSFVLMSLPGAVLAMLGLFAREGPEREFPWYKQLLGGLPVLVLGVLLALGVVTF